MNILIKTASGRITVRPDTTWEKDNEDVFLPDFVTTVSWTPVLFARISKPGRSVSERFADRYYDGIGFGVLLYAENLIDGGEEGFACASCLDHTSFLAYPVFPKESLGSAFELRKDGARAYAAEGEITREIVEKAIEEATRCCYIRTGDILAIELAPRALALKGGSDVGKCRFEGKFSGENSIDFTIII